MRRAGCTRVFFGIESGSDEVLRLMNKRTTAARSRDAVEAAHEPGSRSGAFFILFYPGETDDTVLETLRFAGSLPLDYLGLSMPYPLPGTGLRERLGGRVTRDSRPDGSFLLNQQLTYDGDFSALKMRFGIAQGHGAVRDEAAARALAPPPCGSRGRRGGAVPAAALTAPGAAPAGRPARSAASGGVSCFAANAAIVSSTRRRSQASSISDG